jgi:hypothetical protein
MPNSREELHHLLRKLEKSLPALGEKYPGDEEFLQAFVEKADLIADQSRPEDHSWVHGQIVQMLADMGKLDEGITRTSAAQHD